jgi:hypothetical protein
LVHDFRFYSASFLLQIFNRHCQIVELPVRSATCRTRQPGSAIQSDFSWHSPEDGYRKVCLPRCDENYDQVLIRAARVVIDELRRPRVLHREKWLDQIADHKTARHILRGMQ